MNAERETFALEVKVNEDREAPFGQLVDDLGEYDQVLQVRLQTSAARKKATPEIPGLPDARARFVKAVPARIINLPESTR